MQPTASSSITYRQLHSSTIGPQHPLRVIAHCDIDAAYAQFEQVRLKIPPEKPLAVQQWRGLIAVNYPARAFGITRHLPFDEAKKLCPDLTCVHVATYAQGATETEAKYHENPKPETHKVSLDPYRRESVKILKIFSESCPLIEKASIDEAFLDFSIPARALLLARFPGLLSLEQLQDSSSNVSLDNEVPLPSQLDWNDQHSSSGNNIISTQSEEEHEQVVESSTTWTDVALLIGAELMAQCRKAVFDQLGYTCSAGIATNKMLAKLCSAFKKPNAQTLLRPCAVRSFLRPFEISKIRFLGGKLGQSIVELVSASEPTKVDSETDTRTVGEVWKIPLATLQNKLGDETGMWVWDIVRGIDKTEVEPKTQVKSMMSSKNFRPSISSWDEGVHWLRILSTDLLARLTEARLLAPGLWPKTIVMHKRDASYNTTAKQIAFPFTSKLDREYIFGLGQRLLQEFVVRAARGSSDMKSLGQITSLCLAFQTLERVETGQQGIEGFFASKRKSVNPASDMATDEGISGKDQDTQVSAWPSSHSDASDKKVKAASTIQKTSESPAHSSKPFVSINPPSALVLPKKRKADITEFFNKPTPSSSKTRSKTDSRFIFQCPRCREFLECPSDRGNDELEEDRRERFERIKLEHADQHFAQDLCKEDRVTRQDAEVTKEGSIPKQKQKKQKKISKAEGGEKKGIEAFFKPAASGSSSSKR